MHYYSAYHLTSSSSAAKYTRSQCSKQTTLSLLLVIKTHACSSETTINKYIQPSYTHTCVEQSTFDVSQKSLEEIPIYTRDRHIDEIHANERERVREYYH
ncbi:hypothetical protein P5V15_008586 [Pogonomyrmex californicus]